MRKSRIFFPKVATPRGWTRSALQRFRHEESGALIVLGLFLLMGMLMLGGMALDLMRHEERRVQMQQTLDRSVLAAASLSQRLAPEDVVRDYFDKAGLTEYLRSVSVDEGLNFRTVTADARADTQPFFMHMLSNEIANNGFDASAGAQATQRISNVEISMVLDVSGSMQDDPARISSLKTAAKEFVTTVLTNNTDLISISVVPYSGQVNLGPDLFAQYTGITHRHGLDKSWCVDLPTSSYASTALSSTLAMPQAGFFDAYSGYGTWNDSRTMVPPRYTDQRKPGEFHYINASCEPLANNYVRPFSNNITTLRNQIDALQANGATSIDAGMRWGVALLDPGSRNVVSGLIGAGAVPGVFAGRPADFADRETMKVVVLMTDGAHFPDLRIKDAYRTATSNIYRSRGDGKLSIRFTTGRPTRAGTNEWYVPHLCGRTDSGGRCISWGKWQAAVHNSGAGTDRLTWNKVWEYATVDWVAMHMYARALSPNPDTWSDVSPRYDAQMNVFRTTTPATDMDNRLDDVCDAAKAKGVIVFGIALEALPAGKAVVRNCATSSAHYFEETDSTLLSAFRAISSQISHLRLSL